MSSVLLCATLLLAPISAAPPKGRGTSYRIPRHVVLSGPKNGATILEKAYRRRNWTPPRDLSATVVFNEDVAATPVDSEIKEDVAAGGGGSDTATITAKPYGTHTEYLCPVKIGGQTFNMDLDTGSADFWVFNTALPASDQTGHDAIYNPSVSKSFHSIGGAWFDLSYGDNSSTSGAVGKDTVQIGTITVDGQAVELPNTVTSQFSGDRNSDGIVGLGFSQSGNSIRPSPMPTFFENAAPRLKQNLFTANLKAGGPGQYEFGTIDVSAYQTPLAYAAVNSSGGLWQFDLSQYVVGDNTYGGLISPAIADTGSSLLMLDPAIVDTYYEQVPSSSHDDQGKIFPCDTVLPDFGFGIGSTMLTIPGSLLNYTPVPGTPYCYGGIQSNLGNGLNVLGDIMFASQFVVFDAGALRIGFAPHA